MGSHADTLDGLRKKHGYSEEDLLSPGAARCFEFATVGGRTSIREARMTEDGFVVRSINDPLFRLAEEVVAVQSAEEQS
jgi:hypothetical protein